MEGMHTVLHALFTRFDILKLISSVLFFTAMILIIHTPKQKPLNGLYTLRGKMCLVVGLFGALMSLFINIWMLYVILFQFFKNFDQGFTYTIHHSYTYELQLFFVSVVGFVCFSFLILYSQKFHRTQNP